MKNQSSYVATAILAILLLVIAEQANAYTVQADCIGPCTDNCQQICMSKGYTGWTCASFRTGTGCCCTPPKNPIVEESDQPNN
ncbi:hypothetical protein AALP_AA7G277900 [Arabis alpina]|uniref:Knottin scorpion toxin-like domain-containing protein n=1 Tax=Arabis alpina TaxID=50452 RepID=A0A087GL10_ARAAL|nr:hypothetical protein AALP_AA7G277900 [Arabis alpina]